MGQSYKVEGCLLVLLAAPAGATGVMRLQVPRGRSWITGTLNGVAHVGTAVSVLLLKRRDRRRGASGKTAAEAA